MRNVLCKKCYNVVPLINEINYRIINYTREDILDYICITARIGVYCAICGEETIHEIKHYFNKILKDTPVDYLVDLALYGTDAINADFKAKED